jgi:hypothetical protein
MPGNAYKLGKTFRVYNIFFIIILLKINELEIF